MMDAQPAEEGVRIITLDTKVTIYGREATIINMKFYWRDAWKNSDLICRFQFIDDGSILDDVYYHIDW